MSNKPTIGEILLWWQGQRSVEEHHAKYEEAKQQLTQLIADIIGEDCKLVNCDAEGHKVHSYVLEAQRQRAKERGIDL